MKKFFSFQVTIILILVAVIIYVASVKLKYVLDPNRLLEDYELDEQIEEIEKTVNETINQIETELENIDSIDTEKTINQPIEMVNISPNRWRVYFSTTRGGERFYIDRKSLDEIAISPRGQYAVLMDTLQDPNTLTQWQIYHKKGIPTGKFTFNPAGTVLIADDGRVAVYGANPTRNIEGVRAVMIDFYRSNGQHVKDVIPYHFRSHRYYGTYLSEGYFAFLGYPVFDVKSSKRIYGAKDQILCLVDPHFHLIFVTPIKGIDLSKPIMRLTPNESIKIYHSYQDINEPGVYKKETITIDWSGQVINRSVSISDS